MVKKKDKCDVDTKKPPVTSKNIEAFESFCLWSVLPAQWKGNTPAQIRAMGIHDIELVELLQIKTIKEFGEIYGIHKNTMTQWNVKQRSRDHMADMRMWVTRLSGNVLGNLYKQSVNNAAQASTIKEYFRVAHELGERTEVTVSKELVDALDKLDKLLPN